MERRGVGLNKVRGVEWGATFTVPFNNMWTLKFKIQLTVMLLTAINHCSGPLRKQHLAQWNQRSCSHAVICRFRSTLSVSVFLQTAGCCCNYD